MPCIYITIDFSNITSQQGVYEDDVVGVCHKGYVLSPSNITHPFTTRCLHTQSWSIMGACTRKTIVSDLSLKIAIFENPLFFYKLSLLKP